MGGRGWERGGAVTGFPGATAASGSSARPALAACGPRVRWGEEGRGIERRRAGRAAPARGGNNGPTQREITGRPRGNYGPAPGERTGRFSGK